MVYPWHSQTASALLARRGRLPHALLFCGREGIGKLAFAEAVAAALLCERAQAGGGACGKCASCGWVGQGGHPDLRRLEPEILSESPGAEESQEKKKPSLEIKIEQVREIAGFIAMTSHHGGAKLVLIHPAEALNVNAANALLKNLEEPPPGTHFLLVAHRWHQLLPTIRSRCERVMLPAPDLETARRWLAQQRVPDAELALAQAGGAPLAALQFDESYWRQREALLRAISARGFDALRAAEQLRDSAPALIIALLQKWSFDLAWHKVTGKVRFNPDHSAAIATTAGRLDLVETLRFQRHMVGLQRIATHPLNARLFLEQLLLDYAGLLRGERAAAAA
jgi:DNA polymerase III subunit delta'